MIKLTDLTKRYNKNQENEITVLNGISLEIADGEMVAVTGKSGAGKSTLLHVLDCIEGYDSGEYYLDGQLIKGLNDKKMAAIRNERTGIVLQDFALVEDFTALENVTLPLDFGRKEKGKAGRALKALELVEMAEMADQPVCKMSGGQKQRVAIARAIVKDPGVILADEPTGSLDSENTENVMRIFRELNRQGKTIILVTHDRQIANRCGRVIEMRDGKIIS